MIYSIEETQRLTCEAFRGQNSRSERDQLKTGKQIQTGAKKTATTGNQSKRTDRRSRRAAEQRASTATVQGSSLDKMQVWRDQSAADELNRCVGGRGRQVGET